MTRKEFNDLNSNGSWRCPDCNQRSTHPHGGCTCPDNSGGYGTRHINLNHHTCEKTSYPVINLDDVNPVDEKNLLVFLEQVASGCTSGKYSEWPQLRPAIKHVLSRLTSLEKALEKAKQLIHSEYCSTDCSYHDFIDKILAGKRR